MIVTLYLYYTHQYILLYEIYNYHNYSHVLLIMTIMTGVSLDSKENKIPVNPPLVQLAK